MNRRTNEQWQALFERQEQSGLSQTAFCKEHSLNPKYFSLRRKQLQAADSQHECKAFVRVEPSKHEVSSYQIKLQGNYGELFLPGAVTSKWLAELLKQLA